MSLDHLSEDELQSYCRGQYTKEKTAVAHHLQTCVYCRRQLAAYTYINDEFDHVPAGIFSVNFETRIIEKIMDLEGRRFHLKDYLLPALSIIAYLCTVGVWLLNAQLRTTLVDSLQGGWLILKNLVVDILQSHGQLMPSVEVILFAAMIVLLLNILDKKLLRRAALLTKRDNQVLC